MDRWVRRATHNGVWEAGHIVLEHAQLIHVVLPHDVRPAGQHLPQLDEAGPKVCQGLPAPPLYGSDPSPSLQRDALGVILVPLSRPAAGT